MANIWITGARGFVGRHLARRMHAAGHRVSGLGHGSWPEADAGAWGVSSWLNGEISAANLDQLARASGKPDIVYHLAGGSSVGLSLIAPQEDFRRTAVSTSDLLEWLRKEAAECRLVAISSAAVYGDGHHGPIREDVAATPYSPYGFHKYAMEQICRSYAQSYHTPVAIVRLFSVYGPWLTKQLLWDLCVRLQMQPAELVLGGSGGELRDWTDVRDVARLLEQAAETASPDVTLLNAGRGQGLAVRDVVSLIVDAWGGPSPTIRFSGQNRPGDPVSLVADTSRLNMLDFDWQILPEIGMVDYVRWFQQNSVVAS